MRRVAPLQSARHSTIARIAYSLTCPIFRITVWIVLIAAHEMSGFSQRKNGTINRDVCCADITSVEPTKITPSQITSGSQYLRKDFIQNVRRKIGGSAEANAEHPPSNIERPIGTKKAFAYSIERWTFDVQRWTFVQYV